MSDKLDATISITADTSGVEAGVDKTKKSLKTLGSAAQQASGKISESGKAAGAGMDAIAGKVQKGLNSLIRAVRQMATDVNGSSKTASQGFEQIGPAVNRSAKEVERATRSMQQQLQRQIAELNAGGKATREYTEALARMRGVDVANLRPLLDQLDAARKKTDDAKKSAEGFAGGLASMKTAVAGFATALAGGALFARFIAESKAAEQEQAQLAAVLKSTGEAAGWSQVQLNKMADTLASKSTYSSGAINEAQTRLLSYTNIAGKEFPRAMQAVIDMSARMGMDVKSSAETIGRALDIPSEGLTALTRQGFRFTESQKEMVKQLEATGRASDAQAIILEALESSYGGAAEAARNTFGGALQSVQNSIGSLLTADGESMGSLTNSVNDLNSLLQSDGTKQAFAFYVELMVSSASAAARLAAALAGLKNGGIGAFLGHAASDNAATELVSIETKIANLTKTRDGLSSNWWGRLTEADNIAIANKQLDAMQQQREVLLQYVNDGVDGYEKLGEANANFLAQQEKAASAPVFDGLVASALDATKAYKSKAEQMAEVRQQGDMLRAALKQLEDGEKGTSKEAEQLRERLRGVDERLASMAKSGAAGAAGLKNVESAYATLSKRVGEYITQLALEARQGDKLSAAQKLQIQLDELLAKSKGKLAAAKVAGLKADIQSALSMEKEAAASKLAAAQAEEAAKAYDSVLDATMGRTKSLADQIRAEEEAAAAIGLSKEAVAALEMAKLSDMAATIERKALLMDDIDLSGQQSAALRAEAQAYRDLASVKGQRAVKQANADTAKKAKEDWEKVSKTIGDTLADYIMGGGKDAATYLKRLFATLVLQPVVNYGAHSLLGGGVGGSLGGAGGPDLLGLGKLFSGGSSSGLMGSFSAGMAGGWAGFEGGLEMMKAGQWMKGGAQSLGAAAPYLGGILQMASGNVAGGAGTMAGAYIGSIVPGIGTALGSVLGSIAGDLIGGLFDSNFIPRIGGDVHYGSGGVIRGEGTPEIDRQDEFYKMLEPLALGIGQTLDSTAKMFGLEAGHSLFLAFSMNAEKNDVFGQLQIRDASGEAIVDWAKFNAEWEGRLFSSGEEGSAEFMAALAEDVKFALLSMGLPGWSDQLIEAATDLDSLNQALQGVSTIKASFDALSRSMEMFTGISGELQTVLLETAGSMDALLAGVNAFYQGFYSERERMDRANAQIAQSLSALGYEINPYSEGSKDVFKALVEEAMASGQGELAAQLLAMSAAFAQAADYGTKLFEEMAEAAAEAAEAARELAYDNLEAAIGRERDYWLSVASASQEAVNTLTNTLSLLTSNARALYGTVDSTNQMLAAQGMVYIESALSAVRGGGSITDFDQLQDAISAARGGITGGAYASQFERERDALVLAGQLSELGEMTDAQLSVEERQLKNAEAQLEGLDQTLKYWRQLLDGNASQIDATLSIPQAIEQMARLMGLDVDGGLGGGAGGVGGGSGGTGDDGGASFGGGSGAAGGTKLADQYDALRNVFRHYYGTGDEYGLLSSAKANGYTLRDVTAVSAAMYPDIWGGSTYEQWLEVAKGVGIPAFAVGANRIPQDMLAMVHKDEAIIPKAFNPWAGGTGMGGGSHANAELLAEVRLLRAEVAALKSSSQRTADNTQVLPQMADTVDTVAGSGQVRVTGQVKVIA